MGVGVLKSSSAMLEMRYSCAPSAEMSSKEVRGEGALSPVTLIRNRFRTCFKSISSMSSNCPFRFLEGSVGGAVCS